MSDWTLCELEHFNWDGLGESEDHIVPHPVADLVDERLALSDPHKKLRHAVENNVSKIKHTTGSAINTILWGNPGKEDPFFPTMKNGNSSIVEGSHSVAGNILVPALHDTEQNDISAITSEAKISGNFITDHGDDIESNKFNSKDPVFGASISTSHTKPLHTKPLHSSLNGVSLEATEFPLDNEQKDRQNGLVYCDWPGIDNFDEIDKMFRNWDSTFGQEHVGTADELSWFSSSSNTIYASEIAFEPGLQPSTSELGALYGKREHQCLNTNFLQQDILSSAEHCRSGNESCSDLLDIDTVKKSNFAAEEKANGGGDKIKTLDLVHTSKKNDFSGCGTSNMMEGQPSLQEKGIKRSADKMLLDTDMTAPQMYTSKQFSQKHFIDSTPSSFMQKFDWRGQMEYGVPRHQLPITQSTSCTEFEDDTMPCSSLNDLDHLVKCQTQEGRPNQIYRPQTTRQEENLGKEHQKQQSRIKMTVEHSHQQSVFRNKTPASVKQLETRGGIEQEDVGSELPLVETNSAVAHKSSCVTSVVSDDISFKATSFLQLQDVMHQLDVRTKQCIKDSLYRLARSAHQRHSFSNTNSVMEPNIDFLGIQDTEASKSADPMDSETDTNPIDRSIAHLLFHKPSEPAARSICGATSLVSHVN